MIREYRREGSRVIEKFLARTIWQCVCLFLLFVLTGCGQAEPGGRTLDSAAKGPALVAGEARLADMAREVEVLKAKQQAELKENARKLAEEEENLRKEVNDIRLEGTDLERRIRSLEAENLRMSNEAVVAIMNLKSRLRGAAKTRARSEGR